jgi:hypothetical protein
LCSEEIIQTGDQPSETQSEDYSNQISIEPQNTLLDQDESSTVSVSEINYADKFFCDECPRFFEKKYKLN